MLVSPLISFNNLGPYSEANTQKIIVEFYYELKIVPVYYL